MYRLLTAREAKAVDRYTIEQMGVPSLVLMERAALATAEVCIRELTPGGKALCVCAMGNNGADGVAVARILRLRGYEAHILLAGNEEKATEEMKCQLQIARNLQIPICKADEGAEYIKSGNWQVVVDALFGVGLDRPVEGAYRDLIELINESGSRVIAVDIPSGVAADDGRILGCAVKADVTVTFGAPKLGMILYPGTEYCGEQVAAEIGLAEEAYFQEKKEEIPAVAYDQSDMNRLPVRPAYSNKGTFGRVLVIAGSPNMGGAALFAATAAYRLGAGVVEIATTAENRELLLTGLPEAVMNLYDPAEAPERWLGPALKRAKAVVIGPGMGTGDHTRRILRDLLDKAKVPVMIDADGLNVLAAAPELAGKLAERTAEESSERASGMTAAPVILTPHLGEMSRLTGKSVGEIQQSLLSSARAYSEKTGAICVLKDARTVVAAPDGRTYVNTSGNCGMATGGSGDLLAGIIGALAAEGLDAFESACLGVYVHGLYGDQARDRYGERTMLASDLAAVIGI